MRRHRQIRAGSLLPLQSSGQVDRIQSPERSRERLAGPREYGPRRLDDLYRLEEPKHSLPSHSDVVVLKPLGHPQPVQRAQAFDFDQSRGDSLLYGPPLLQGVPLT